MGFLVQRCDKTSVQELFDIAWVTVGQIVERVVHRHRPDDPLEGLLAIGVDELSYRKGHKYVTTVTDLLSGRIVWAAEGKSAATLLRFFEDLGDARCAALAVVTMDMSEAYITAVQQQLPTAQIVFDRFHVQQLVSKALDDTRRAEWRRLRGIDKEEAKGVKGLRWPLLKNPWNLTPSQTRRLSTLPRDNGRLYRAYLLKETFADILSRRQPNVVKAKLREWLSWASRSRLPGFVAVARTIRRHLDDIVAYIRWRLTNGLVEGLHNKVRVITRRAFGFHSAAAVIGMITLCCTNLALQPPPCPPGKVTHTNFRRAFLPPARATASMFRSGPFTRAGNRQASAVDDEMKACAPWNAPKPEVEVLATTGQRRVIRRPKVESHQHEERREKALCLTEREMEEKTQRQGGLDREVRVLPLRASRARSVRFPGGDGRRGHPDGDVTDQMVMSPRQTRARS